MLGNIVRRGISLTLGGGLLIFSLKKPTVSASGDVASDSATTLVATPAAKPVFQSRASK